MKPPTELDKNGNLITHPTGAMKATQLPLRPGGA